MHAPDGSIARLTSRGTDEFLLQNPDAFARCGCSITLPVIMKEEYLANTHGLKEMKMRWSNTIELYPLAMQTSEFGVLRSMISVDATFEG